MTGPWSKGSLLVITNWRDGRHPDAGGAEEVCEQLARRFAAHGWKVVLLTSHIDGQAASEDRDGYRVIRRGGRFTVYLWSLLWISLHRASVRAVIDSQNGIPFFTPLVVGKRTPVLLLLHHVHHDLFELYFSPIKARFGQWLESTGTRWVYRRRAVVAVSPSTRTGARRVFRLRGEIFVVPPGCATVAAEAPKASRRSAHHQIVWVGRLVPQKRIGLILDALPELLRQFPALEFHLIGEGPERPSLEEHVARLGLGSRVFFHGVMSPEERVAVLRTSWLSVTASESEGWGPGVVEANAQGLPVLAFRRPGLRDSIRHEETGWLIDDDQPLGPAIGTILERLADAEYAERVGTAAQRWIARFTWDEMAKHVHEILLAEEGRLRHAVIDRRSKSDLASVALVPFELLPDDQTLNFRPTDQAVVGEKGLIALLRGTDTVRATVALQRAGLPRSVVADPSVSVRVARPADYVSLDVSINPWLPGSLVDQARTRGEAGGGLPAATGGRFRSARPSPVDPWSTVDGDSGGATP